MRDGLKNLIDMEYPGRFIILGQDVSEEYEVAVYGITGRSPPSQARRLVLENNVVRVEPTDKKEIEKGNPDLLFYDAIVVDGCSLMVSNGKQTNELRKHRAYQPLSNIIDAFTTPGRPWTYEPDPNFTPRISGLNPNNDRNAVFCIIKKDKKAKFVDKIQHFFEFPKVPGQGKLIATYTGVNKDPLPSFVGEPLDVLLEGKTAKEVALAVYDAIGPKHRGADKNFRVSVAAVFHSRDLSENETNFYIVNRHGRGE